MAASIEFKCCIREPGGRKCRRRATHDLLPGETARQAVERLCEASGWEYSRKTQRAICPEHSRRMRGVTQKGD